MNIAETHFMHSVEPRLAVVLARHWWVLLLRGLVAVTFGVLAWFQPGISLMALVFLFGAYALVDGILGVWTAITGQKEHRDWWILLLWGLIGIGAGVLTLLAPGITSLALLFYIAAWAIATGVLGILTGIRLHKEIEGEWWLILSSLVSVVFGALLMAQPAAGALTVVWLIGTYAIIFGILLAILAFEVRAFGKHLSSS